MLKSDVARRHLDARGSIVQTVARSGNKSESHQVGFVQQGRKKQFSHAQLDRLAFCLSQRLEAAGFSRGDRIGILAKNGMEWVLLDLAAVKAGIVTAGFEFGKFQSVSELVDNYGLKGIYADIPIDHDTVVDLRPFAEEVLTQGPDLVAIPPEKAAGVRYSETDCTTIKFTSGSTGDPKGLFATVGSIDTSIASVQSILKHEASDNILVFLPLSLLQQRYWIYSALTYRHDVTVTSFQYALAAAMEAMPTVIMGVPGFFESVKKHVERQAPEASDDTAVRRKSIEALLGSRLRYLWTGSAPASPDMLAFYGGCGIDIFEGYGMNETCIVSKNYPGHHKPGSSGQVLPHKRLRIDDDGVLIVGSDYPVNTSYAYCALGDNEKIFLPDNEVRTGDLARIDKDGYLYILGRADDVVVLANGKNVHVRKIEEKIRRHPGVDDCVLFGSGERYLVAVISPSDALVTEVRRQDIAAHVRSVNRDLPRDEQVHKSFIAPEAFSIQSGLLTSQFKPKRKEIFRRFRREISELYEVPA